ncbi:MAG: hypothetical protein JKY48_02655 [Flavobacteriales bacterium]|nr:hypothetical protein [Flavobacteriales bacterium]
MNPTFTAFREIEFKQGELEGLIRKATSKMDSLLQYYEVVKKIDSAGNVTRKGVDW